MKIVKDEILFTTGTVKNANKGIIGLSPDLCVYEGYDGPFHQPHEDYMGDAYDELLVTEQIELAEYMIKSWEEFKSKVK